MSMNYGEIVEYGMLVDQEMVALVIRYLLKTQVCVVIYHRKIQIF